MSHLCRTCSSRDDSQTARQTRDIYTMFIQCWTCVVVFAEWRDADIISEKSPQKWSDMHVLRSHLFPALWVNIRCSPWYQFSIFDHMHYAGDDNSPRER